MAKKKSEDYAVMINKFIQEVVIKNWKGDHTDLAKAAGLTPSAVSECQTNGRGIGLRSFPGFAKPAGYRTPGALLDAAAEWYRQAYGQAQPTPARQALPPPMPAAALPPEVASSIEELKTGLETLTKVFAISLMSPSKATTPPPQSGKRPSKKPKGGGR